MYFKKHIHSGYTYGVLNLYVHSIQHNRDVISALPVHKLLCILYYSQILVMPVSSFRCCYHNQPVVQVDRGEIHNSRDKTIERNEQFLTLKNTQLLMSERYFEKRK